MNLHAFRNRLTKLFRIVKKEVLVVSFWIFVGTLCLWGFDEAGMLSRNSQIKEVVVDFPEVYQVWKKDEAVFVDGRSNAAFKRGHIPGAMSVPVGKVKKRLALLPEDKNTRLIVYCSSAECPIFAILVKSIRTLSTKSLSD